MAAQKVFASMLLFLLLSLAIAAPAEKAAAKEDLEAGDLKPAASSWGGGWGYGYGGHGLYGGYPYYSSWYGYPGYGYGYGGYGWPYGGYGYGHHGYFW